MDEPADEMFQPNLAENVDQRLHHHCEETSQPIVSHSQETTMEQHDQPEKKQTVETSSSPNQVQYHLKNELNREDSDDDDDNSDFDSDDDDDDDDPALEAFRQRRLAELQRTQIQKAENKAKGHGDYRTISQDEFLPECTGSAYVAVHFFHKDFERCKIMDHHLKMIAQSHLSCKFIRIDAEKSPFFVAKLNVKTLPTLIVFKDGKSMERLTGFDGLSNSKYPDEFPTCRLGVWLEKTGAIEYEGPDSDDEESTSNVRGRTRMLQSRLNAYDDDI